MAPGPGQPPEIKPPAPEAILALPLRAEQDDRAFVVFLVSAAVTGTRSGELVALRWSHLDLQLGALTITRAISESRAMCSSSPTNRWLGAVEAGLREPRVRRLSHSVGRDQVRLHDLRHFVATTLLGAGADLQTVAGRFGHAGGGKTTLAVYTHFQQVADRNAADLMGELLSSSPSTPPHKAAL